MGWEKKPPEDRIASQSSKSKVLSIVALCFLPWISWLSQFSFFFFFFYFFYLSFQTTSTFQALRWENEVREGPFPLLLRAWLWSHPIDGDLSHMATHSCKGGREMQSLPGWLAPQLLLLLNHRKKNGLCGGDNKPSLSHQEKESLGQAIA